MAYSEWIDPGDQTVIDSVNEFDFASAVIRMEAQDHQVTEGDLEGAFTAAKSAGEGTAGTNPAGYSWVHQMRLGVMYGVWSGEFARHRFTVGAPKPIAYQPTRPPGAVGLEYEGTAYDPANPFPVSYTPPHAVGIAAEALLRTDIEDSTAPALVLSSAWTTHIMASGLAGAVEAAVVDGISAPAGVHTQPVGAVIDLTGIFGPTMTGAVWTETRTFVPPANVNPSTAGAFQVHYGWRFPQLLLAYTARPPRYRWVFPDDEPVTYRRTYPRDDSLGGGAARTWPPSKAVQASNRTFGGYL